MLEIRTFGTLMFRDPVADADLATLLSRPKRAALLAYLASARPHGLRRRDELFALFWPELPQQNARKALNQSVYVLRSVIGQTAIVSRGGEEVGVDPAFVSCDAAAFEEALSRGDRGAALELYAGEFLAAFHMPGSRSFERWLDAEREHYRRRAIEAAIRQATTEERAGNGVRTVRWLRRALEWSPYDEALLESLVRALARQGDVAGATHELERFAARLRTDLGLEVSPETRAVLDGSLKTTVPPTTETEAALLRSTAAIEAAEELTVENTDESTVQTADEPTAAGSTPHGSPRGFPLRRAAGLVLAGGLLGIALFTGMRSDVPVGVADPTPQRVLVTPLENRTGSESLDPLGRIAADWIARGLLRTGLVEVVPIASTGESDGALSTNARSVEADLAFSGSFHRDGGQLVIQARIIDADRGAILRSLPPILAPEGDPLTGLDRLRQRTTGALATLVDPRFEDWADDASQPPDFVTYLVYVDAMERFERGDRREAGDLFLAVAARDSTFASALVWAMQAYYMGGGPRDSVALALEPMRAELAPWDRAMLDFHLADTRGDRRAAHEAMRRVVRLSPTAQWRIVLAEHALRVNRPRETLQLLDGIEPEQVTGIPASAYWITRGIALHSLERFEEELAHVERWRARSPGAGALFELGGLAGLGRGDEVLRWVMERTREWEWSASRADFLRRIALELRAHGQRQAALAVLEQSFTLYGMAPDSVRRDGHSRRQLGRSLYSADRWEHSRAVFDRLLSEGYDTHIIRGDIGLAAARLGDRAVAEQMIDWYGDWNREHPQNSGWATQWRARIAAALGDRDDAVRFLRQAYAEGWAHTPWDHRNEEYENLRGYAAFEELMRPM
jgi:DNA-binding SARP family transcriptional activator/tetratricopeptide (TPR) repeat protein/TolB-like protein